MSADRDYWTELKQLFMYMVYNPWAAPPPFEIVQACLGLCGSSGLMRLFWAHATYPGSYQFVRACPGTSGLI